MLCACALHVVATAIYTTQATFAIRAFACGCGIKDSPDPEVDPPDVTDGARARCVLLSAHRSQMCGPGSGYGNT